MKWVIGIDEAGRGPLAGPVTVAAFCAHTPGKTKKKLLRILGGKIKDSKQLSPTGRVAIYRYICRLRKDGEIDFQIRHISNSVIDKRGISEAVRRGIQKVLLKWQRASLAIRLDGLLKAPTRYKHQKTIIKGDEKDIFIACASIVAKVSRDALMCRLARKYPQYSFEVHKGYGTVKHRSKIMEQGLCSLHRVSFCANIMAW